MLTTVKTVLGSDIRRFTLDPSTLATASLFGHVAGIINDSYDLRGARFALSYMDDEGDQCAVSGDDEMKEAFRFACTHHAKVLKLQVALLDAPAVVRAPSSAAAGVETKSPRLAPAASPAPVAPAPVAAPAPPPVPKVKFVADLSVPDGEVHSADSIICKAWSVKNVGSAAWPGGCALVHVSGSLVPLGTVALPSVLPGDTATIRVECRVPSTAGCHRSEWAMTQPDGKTRFEGDCSMWCDVLVRSALSVEFVADVTLADGATAAPNSTVRKVWRLRNDGVAAWPAGSMLVFDNGTVTPSPLDTRAAKFTPKESKEVKAGERIAVPVPSCEPGAAVDVSVLVQLPPQSGVARGEWRLCTADGTMFDHDFALWTSITVTAPVITKDDLIAQLPTLLTDADTRAAVAKILAGFGAGAGAGADAGDKVIHEGIQCDGCGMSPIAGLRFKCQSCDDFDLCAACEAKGNKHPADHILIKAKRPLMRSPSLTRTPSAGKSDGVADWRAPAASAAAAAPSPAKKGNSRRSGASSGAPRAQFVADLSLPDGCVVQTGSEVTKNWSIKNVGSIPWPTGVRLMYVGGTLMPAPPSLVNSSPSLSPVPVATPGQSVEVSARVAVPREPGRYTGYYRLATAEGKRFGHRMWLDVAAVAPAATAATATPAAAPAPAAASKPAEKPAEVKDAKKPASVAAAPAPAPAAAAAAATPAVPYAEELARLRGMGFRDDEMLRELLVAANGNQQQVIDWLTNPVV